MEIAWLFRHSATGALGDPPPSASPRRRWGRGEIEALLEGQIHNGRSLLRIEQPAGDSYTAHLSFARFPDLMPFPDGEPWLHFSAQLPFPVEISSRMRLIPPVRASKDVARKLAHARDMDIHIREAGAEAPLALAEQIDAARMLEHGITKERLPFVYGWHRMSVSAPSEEMCVQRVEAVVEHYRDLGIDVVNSTGDQFSLFCEALPGEKVRVNAYAQRQPLRTIAGGMATATVDLGASIACSGVCLTVVDKGASWFAVDVSGETVGRSANGQWSAGRRLNLERAMKLGDELGGHIVTGHVDGVAEVLGICPEGDSKRIGFRVPSALAPVIAPKGSITVDGVSLTVNEVEDQADGTTHFSINLIPHTQKVTTLGGLEQGQAVNIEIDVLARYLQRMEHYHGRR